jgi:hypothetical protein
MAYEALIADAHFLREEARKVSSENARHRDYQQAYLIAAEAFIKSATASTQSRRRQTYFRNAADCFERADELPRAAEASIAVEEYTAGLKLYRKAGMFDEAVDVLRGHRENIDNAVAEAVVNVAKLQYLRNLARQGNLECVA